MRPSPSLTYVFTLIESLGYLAREDRVDGADDYQDDGVGEGDHVARVDVAVADEQIVLAAGIVMHGAGRVDHHPDAVYQDLHEHEHRADYQLRAGRDERGSLGAVLARPEDPRDPVRLGQEGGVDHCEAEARREPANPEKGVVARLLFLLLFFRCARSFLSPNELQE